MMSLMVSAAPWVAQKGNPELPFSIQCLPNLLLIPGYDSKVHLESETVDETLTDLGPSALPFYACLR